MEFMKTKTATLKANRPGYKDQISLAGITTSETLTPEAAATQANKLLGIVGYDIIANTKMTRNITEEAIENG